MSYNNSHDSRGPNLGIDAGVLLLALLLALLVAVDKAKLDEPDAAAILDPKVVGWVNLKMSLPFSFFSVTLCTNIMIVRALRCTSTSRGHICRQCNSMSTHPGVRARILTKAGVKERLRKTRHPRLSIDLFV